MLPTRLIYFETKKISRLGCWLLDLGLRGVSWTLRKKTFLSKQLTTCKLNLVAIQELCKCCECFSMQCLVNLLGEFLRMMKTRISGIRLRWIAKRCQAVIVTTSHPWKRRFTAAWIFHYTPVENYWFLVDSGLHLWQETNWRCFLFLFPRPP